MSDATTIQDTLETMPLEKIKDLHKKAIDDKAHAEYRLAMFNGEITRRFKASFAAQLAQKNKESGDISFVEDGLSLKGEIKKTVKWDTKLLAASAAAMTWEQANAVFKIEFTIPEAVYKTLEGANPALYKSATAARTVKYSEPTVTIKHD